MSTIKLGQAIPDFEAESTAEIPFKLSNYRGKKVILYFYPRDNTPGCTQEGKDFSQYMPQFEALNTVVQGISRDSIRVHNNFKTKHQFPFDLLSDQDETLCQLFDVIKMENMYGKSLPGIERSTFLIDEQGVLIYEWRKVKVKTHVTEVLDKLRQFK